MSLAMLIAEQVAAVCSLTVGTAGVGFISLISNSSERSEIQPSLVAFTLYFPTVRPEILPSEDIVTPLTVLPSDDLMKI